METTNNYAVQATQAKRRFLTYDQEKLIQKFDLCFDEQFLYIPMLHERYRLSRTTGNLERQTQDGWADANSFGEVMTLLDLLCDSREDRHLSGKWKNMAAFGLMFHKDLLEGQHDPWADRFESDPEGFRRACMTLGGSPFPTGDQAYTLELFDGLPITLQLWYGDEEFPASLRLLWDENATMYIRYETMYFAKGLLLEKITHIMEK